MAPLEPKLLMDHSPLPLRLEFSKWDMWGISSCLSVSDFACLPLDCVFPPKALSLSSGANVFIVLDRFSEQFSRPPRFWVLNVRYIECRHTFVLGLDLCLVWMSGLSFCFFFSLAFFFVLFPVSVLCSLVFADYDPDTLPSVTFIFPSAFSLFYLFRMFFFPSLFPFWSIFFFFSEFFLVSR